MQHITEPSHPWASILCLGALLCAMPASAASPIPSSFAEFEYIESTGTQFIDTGVVPTNTTRVVCDFRFTETLTDRARNGWASAGSQEAFWFGTDNDHATFTASVCGNSVASSTGVAFDTSRHTFDISPSALKFDEIEFTNQGSDFASQDSTGSICLFASRQGWNPAIGAYGKMALYSCQIYDGALLVRDFVPAVRLSDGAAGLWETVNGDFYENQGSGDFSAGITTFFASSIPSQTVSSFAELFAGVKPSVTVSNLTTGTELVLGTDYTVSYSGNTAIGTAYAVIIGMGDYDGKTVLVPFAITGLTAYYAIPNTSGNDAADQSTVSGTSKAIGWASSRGGTAVAVRGITAPSSIYYIWTNRLMRTPPGVNFATPTSTAIVVKPSCVWTLADKLKGNTLTLSNVLLQANSSLTLSPWGDGNTGALWNNSIGGAFALEEGASICLNASNTGQDIKQYVFSASATGKGVLVAPSGATSQASVTQLVNKITGDISGFTGDIATYNGGSAVVMELVNANSIPGDPPAGETAYVVVTNGATLKIDQDWTSPANRVWDFGDGARPTVFVADGKTVEIRGPLKGSSGFVKTGAGTLVLRNASPSFSGMCHVLSGKVCLEGGARKLAPLFRRKETLSLPTGYTLLDHLSLTGGGVDSYIDTGYTPTTATFGFVFDWSSNENAGSSGHRVMGSAYRDGNTWNGVMVGNYSSNTGSSSGQFVFGTTLASVPASSAGGYLPYERMRLMLANGFAELDRGWSQSFGTATTPAYYGSIYIGTIHTQTVTAGSPQDVYRFQVLEGDTLLHDFVPVLRASDGAIGLYDTFGDLGFRGAADAQYISAGPAYSGSDSEWLEVAEPTGLQIMVR